MNKRSVGADYEERAVDYLAKRGFRVMERNFRSRQGEIDIVGIHKGQLVFVEVKYRRNRNTGFPEEAVDGRKQKRICRTSDLYRLRHREYGELQVRYDVVSICGESLRWYQNAFDYMTGGYAKGGMLC